LAKVEQEEHATQARRMRERKDFMESDGTKTSLFCQLDSKAHLTKLWRAELPRRREPASIPASREETVSEVGRGKWEVGSRKWEVESW